MLSCCVSITGQVDVHTQGTILQFLSAVNTSEHGGDTVEETGGGRNNRV